MRKQKGKLYSFIAVIILLAICSGCGNNSSSGIAATASGLPDMEIVKVGDNIITSRQLQEYMIITALNAGKRLDDYNELERKELRETTLESMISNTVIRRYLEELGVTQMTPEIFASSQQVASVIMSSEALTNLVKDSEISQDTFDMYVAFCQYADWFYWHVKETVDLSDQILLDYYEEHEESLKRTYVSAAHILTAKYDEAAEIIKKLENGEDFADLAETFSLDLGTKNQGGILPDFGRNDTVPEFEEAVFSMEIGEIRGPVRTMLGHHIIQLLYRYTEDVDYDIVEFYIGDVLVREACNEKIRQLRQETSIIYIEQAGVLR